MEDSVQGIGDFVIDAYATYGNEVNLSRHVPHLYDGCKPVYKRTILGAFDIASNKKIKSATLSGHVSGHTHPHGSASVEPVVAELVNMGFLIGQGNFGVKSMFRWGDLPPAAARYLEVMVDPKWKEIIGKLLPYVPEHKGELDEMEADYIPSPFPWALVQGSFGIGIGLTVNIPAFEMSSIIKAGYHAVRGDAEPWLYLQPNYGLSISDEDKKSFWFDTKGYITYNFKVTPGYSGGLSGWYISGDPSFVKPKVSELFKAKNDGGKIVIRDESAKGEHKIFIARAKRIKTITDSEVEEMVYRAASVKKFFSLYVVYNGQTRPIAGGDWIQKTMLNYNEVLKRYRQDQVNKINLDIEAFQNFRQIADKILNTNDTYPKIRKELGLSEGVVERVAGMAISTLRTTDPTKRLKKLYEEKEKYSKLTTKEVLKDFLK